MFERLSRELCFISHVKLVSVLFGGLFLAGCAASVVPLSDRIRLINRDAYVQGTVWQEGTVQTDGLQLAVVRRASAGGYGKALRIYMEGDGHAYISRGMVSGDPTPLNPVGLELALADEGGGEVVYLGRPCQWVRGPECTDRSLWTTGRFTERMARAYAEIVAQESGGRPVELIGYSGGAWVALQVAARLDNVVGVTTVAGNLAPDYVNAHHKVARIEVAPYPQGRLAELPVTAYIGTKDRIVPRGTVEDYRRQTAARNLTVKEVPASHGEGWKPLFGRI